MNTLEMLLKVLPILLTIVLGYILIRVKVLKESSIDALKKIVVNVTLPVGLFAAFTKIRFKSEYLLIILSIFITCFILFYIAKLIAKVFSIKSKYFPFLMTAFEAGMMGYALFATIYGADSAADFGVADIGQVLFVFLVFVPMIINLESKQKGIASIKKSIMVAVKSPVIWAIVLGLVGSVLKLWMYEDTQAFIAINDIFTFISSSTAFLICLVIGSGLQLSVKNMKLEIITAVLKIVFALAFAFLLKYLVFLPLGIDARIITGLFVLFSMPAPFVIPVFMQDPSAEDVSYVSNTLSIGSILGVLSFTAVILLS